MSRISDKLLSLRARKDYQGYSIYMCPFCKKEWGEWTNVSLKEFWDKYPEYPESRPPIEYMVCDRCKEIWLLVTGIQELKLILVDEWYNSRLFPFDLFNKTKSRFHRLLLIHKQNELHRILEEENII